MEQLIIIAQGLAYSGIVVAFLAKRLRARRAGTLSIFAAAALSAVVHALLTFLIPTGWEMTWLVFWVPGHILTPLVLLWLQRRNTEA